VLIRFNEAESGMYDSLRIINSDDYEIDDDIEVELHAVILKEAF